MTPLAVCVAPAAFLAGQLFGYWLGSGTMHPRSPAGRCVTIPLDYVRCCRSQGHRGDHMVRVSDVVNAHYERSPF